MNTHRIDLFDGSENLVASLEVRTHIGAVRIWRRLSSYFEPDDYSRSVTAEWVQGDRLLDTKRINRHLSR